MGVFLILLCSLKMGQSAIWGGITDTVIWVCSSCLAILIGIIGIFLIFLLLSDCLQTELHNLELSSHDPTLFILNCRLNFTCLCIPK